MSVAMVEAAGYESAHPLTEVHGHLGVALRRLRARRRRIDLYWRYYDGEHPQLWMTARFRRLFGRTFESSLHDNWCELAVEAPLFRLGVTGWTKPTEDTATGVVAGAQAQWEANDLDLEQEEIYRAAMVAGEAYLIVWPREDDDGNQVRSDGGVDLYDMALNDARNVYLQTGTNRRNRRWAAKVWWAEEERRWRANLYYADEIVRLVAPVAQASATPACPTKPDVFDLDPDDPGGENPMETVPVFRFARDRRGKSRLHALIPVQDKINKLEAGKMVAAEFLAWRQRIIMTAEDIPDEKLRPEPGSVLVLDPGGDTEDGKFPPTSVHEFAATELSNYDESKRSEIETFFSLALLPRHLMVNPGTSPSGDAVRADEGMFVSLIQDMTAMWGGTWRDVMAAVGFPAAPQWAEIEVANGEALAREVQYLVAAGVPVEVVMEQVAGWDDERLTKLREAMAQQARRQADAGVAALGAFDQGVSADELADRIPKLGGGPADRDMDVPAEVAALPLKERIELAVRLVQGGWDADTVAQALSLPAGLVHTGKVPKTLYDDGAGGDDMGGFGG